MDDWTAQTTLEGRFIRLEPLTLERAGPEGAALPKTHAEGWLKFYDPSIFEFQGRGGPEEGTLEAVQRYLKRTLEEPNRLNWTIRVLETGDIAGRISYSEMRPAHRALEIGTTIFKPFWGTAVNPEAKLLMLEQAFERLGALRVQFKSDARNGRSHRALEKLGATREGVLRRYQTRPDGFVRDSVMLSVLDDEWPNVRSRLDTQLERFVLEERSK